MAFLFFTRCLRAPAPGAGAVKNRQRRYPASLCSFEKKGILKIIAEERWLIILGDLQLGHKDLDTWKPGPNSAGGVSVQIIFQNDTQKTIKYVYFDVVPYNAVKDA